MLLVCSESKPKMTVLKSILFVATILISSSMADRKLHAELNPGCSITNCSSLSKLLYIRADGDNDTVHYLFDFTTKPSLVILTTVIDAKMEVKYDEIKMPDSIKFTKPPSYMFASVFNKLYEFDDVNDTAILENGKHFLTMDFKNYFWNMTLFKIYNNESVEVTISSNLYRAPGITKTGTVSITLKVYAKKDKGMKLPHLVHTPESGELTLTLDQLTTNFTNSRFAVELLTLSSFPFNKTEELVADQSSDDKSSSGTFVTYFIDTKGDDKEGGGYLSWRPVVYKAANTHALNSSSTVQYSIQDYSSQDNEVDWIATPLYKLYGNELFKKGYLMKATNVSFGEPADGFYSKSNYLYWTFLVGVGAPPNSSLGVLEMSIIASLLLMLTITMILLFCIFMRWMSSKRNSIIYGQ